MRKSISHPSPNFGERKGKRVDSILLHYTEMESTEASLARLCDVKFEVSCHYLIDEKGNIYSLVPEDMRAWHAGRSFWRGERDINSCSIGIELQNTGHMGGCPPYSSSQIQSLIYLLRDLRRRYHIPFSRILGHSDVAPLRKKDPGEHFPWQKVLSSLRCPSLRIFSGKLRFLTPPRFLKILASLGYDISEVRAAVNAFQRRYLPQECGKWPSIALYRIAFSLHRR